MLDADAERGTRHAEGSGSLGSVKRLWRSWRRFRAGLWPCLVERRHWLGIGVAATALVLMNDLGAILEQVSADGAQAHSSRTMFLPGNPFDTSDLQEAFALWAAEGAVLFASLHTLVDLAFIAAYAWLLYRILVELGSSITFARTASLLVATADVFETVVTLGVLNAWPASGPQGAEIPSWTTQWLFGLRALTWLKWLALGYVVIAGAGMYFGRRFDGNVSFQRVSPTRVLLPQQFLVGVFLVVVAVPVGGPLEQFPEVVRLQLFDQPARLLVAAATAAWLVAVVLVAGWVSTLAVESRRPAWSPRRNLAALGAAVALLASVHLVAAGRVSWVVVSAPVVVGVFMGVGWFASKVPSQMRVQRHEDTGQLAIARADVQSVATLAVSATAAATVLGTTLGIVRATWRLALLEGGASTWAFLVVGVSSSVGLPWLLAGAFGDWRPSDRVVRSTAFALGVVALAAVIALGVEPLAIAPVLGSSGTLALVLGAGILGVGVLAFHTRRTQPWKSAERLQLRRTPVLSLVVATWLLAGALQFEVSYHAARSPVQGATTRSLDAGLQDPNAGLVAQWVEAMPQRCRQLEHVPLVLVAAPGGGIRAAYWTASVLDSLSVAQDHPCGANAVFAVSGVSGGSVGTAAWLASPAGHAREAVRDLAADRALAASIASLLTRDLVQPLVGMPLWSDRASVHEAAWEEALPAWTDKGITQLTGPAEGWTPVVVFNGSSVGDGCRVLIGNVEGIGSSPGSCLTMEAPSAFSASIGVGPKVTDAGDPVTERSCSDDGRTLRVGTAALLSARFPVVSPSGAVLLCEVSEQGGSEASERPRPVFVVDGGYYENSGLLTLLQLWSVLEPQVSAFSATHDLAIEPWIVLADNKYRPRVEVPQEAPSRPHELLLPMRTWNRGQTTSIAALTQRARQAMSRSLSEPDEASCAPRFLRLGPSREPQIEAPLGWVLASGSIARLQGDLEEALDDGRESNQRFDTRLPNDVERFQTALAGQFEC